MKIEKKKVTGIKKPSAVVKGAIASAFGIAATFSLSACIDNAEAGDVIGPVENPESSGDTESQPSSSSVIDIPKSQEALSSSAIEALSSAAEKLSSSSVEPIIEAGILPPYEDVPDANSSSDAIPASSANIPSSSSEAAEQSSSSSDIGIQILDPAPTDTNYNPRIHICNDPDGCMIFSMVTTFEQDDLQA